MLMNPSIRFKRTDAARLCDEAIYILGVVEQSTVPQIMETASVVVKEAAVSSVELVQTVDRVFTRMAVYNVQKDNDTTSMSLVYQLLQLIRRSIATTTHRRTKTSHFIFVYT